LRCATSVSPRRRRTGDKNPAYQHRRITKPGLATHTLKRKAFRAFGGERSRAYCVGRYTDKKIMSGSVMAFISGALARAQRSFRHDIPRRTTVPRPRR
jgi:hypothetical protein